jgi:NAD(P)-dependent dehydrogenase (short-subunit alcohol dehydrogenase family)
MGRMDGKKAIIVGAGQTPGPTIGNGKAMAMLFAREGAEVFCVDRELDRARETVQEIIASGGKAVSFQADIRQTTDCAALVAEGKAQMGRIDILVNNVGTGRGDGPPHAVEEEAYDFIMNINLKSAVMTTKAVLPIMREQGAGAILSISSLAAWAGNDKIAYEVSKAGMIRHIQAVATGNAKYGVRANAILPGLMDTPMAIVGISTAKGIDPDELRAIRNKRVPMGAMGTGWDTAYAALFLCSDEAKFITGVALPVDGGAAAVVGG